MNERLLMLLFILEIVVPAVFLMWLSYDLLGRALKAARNSKIKAYFPHFFIISLFSTGIWQFVVKSY